MIDDPYRDADLVELYDLDNPGGEDHACYGVLADEIDARLIIDLYAKLDVSDRAGHRPRATPEVCSVHAGLDQRQWIGRHAS